MPRLTKELLHRFALGQAYKDNTARINGMDYTATGEWLITSSDDESLHLYNCISAQCKKTVLSRRYGVSQVRFTHHSNAVIVASKNSGNNWDDTIRYLSLHDNKYLRFFRGHRHRVVSLEMSPVDDSFLSASLDGTVRLWDVRTNACQGLLRVRGRPCVAYDTAGLVFGVASAPGQIRMYDAREFDKGPFATFTPPIPPLDPSFTTSPVEKNPSLTASSAAEKSSSVPLEWHTMRFSPDGKHLLLSTNQPRIALLDAFDGALKQMLSGHVNDNGSYLEASFSPDAQFVLSGSEDGGIYLWESATGKRMCVWTGHNAAVGCVQWNPTRMMVASACTQLGFWIPTIEAKGGGLLRRASGKSREKTTESEMND